jgi:hypothetical protein
MLTSHSPATQQVEDGRNRGKLRTMVSYVGIFLGTMLAGAAQFGYKAITGKDMFPANPKGPLYKWFGDPERHERRRLKREARINHEPSPTPSQLRRRDQLMERLSGQPSRRARRVSAF